ncbi:ATP synthase F1 subunit delta [Butyrivibrio sp. MC2013]|uniref:ATP synthase F1 subunit delta n=1 Tax=Butyrivibrio sp. MC2013 TaxID=1280686 RepID=UPI000405284D|nr:ATP synthase F1 subunit delta [Butyrivibrio sp. MC2013]
MMTETARNYGGSFYDLAVEENKADEVLSQLEDVQKILNDNPDYLRLLSEPSINKDERIGLLDEAFASQLWPYLLNFLKLLCERGLLGEFRGCVKEYKRRYNKDHGIAEATVTSAAELSDSQKAALLKKLEEMSGKKVDMICYVNPALIGGIRLDMEGKRYDGTAASRMEAIRSLIESAPLQ